ncbi:MAG: toxin-antitoxin system HicB family antitoxin [Caldilineaceae bacterium]|nr:toxin-antitoxin system HicB family antitoxin [Caldilineaceae bacterium]
MTTLSLRLPESLHKGVQAAAKRDGISINQFVATAVAEKLAALLTEDYLAERAERASREIYLAALDQVPDIEPVKDDERDPLG